MKLAFIITSYPSSSLRHTLSIWSNKERERERTSERTPRPSLTGGAA